MPTADEVKAGVIDALGSTTNREVLNAGRSVVMRSANRWRRVADANPCGFCAMLASRGPVYRSADKAGGNRWHNHCGCTVEEFDGDPSDWVPTPGEQRFIEAYDSVHMSGMSGDETAQLMQEWLNENAATKMGEGFFKSARLITSEVGTDEAIANANPLRSTGERDYLENCSNCSVAVEARMRGYDVTAAPHHDGRNGQAVRMVFRRREDGQPPRINWMAGNGTRDMAALYKDPSMPVGARGIMAASWKRGGGHFWNWEKTAAGIRFYDSQTGKSDALSYLRQVRPGHVGWMRTDDCDFAGELADLKGWLVWE